MGTLALPNTRTIPILLMQREGKIQPKRSRAVIQSNLLHTPLFAFHDFFILQRFRQRSENVSIRQSIESAYLEKLLLVHGVRGCVTSK